MPSLDALSALSLGFLASLAAGLGTAVGALPALAVRNIKRQTQNALLGFGAGVMLAATAFSLIEPAVRAAANGTGSVAAAAIVSAGVLLGAGALWLANATLPHEHFVKGREGSATTALRRTWLFVFAITLHNFPEGLAVGVGFGGGHDMANGLALALGIGLQNLPEGLVVALALISEGKSRLLSVAIAAATGLVEPVGGALGSFAVWLARPLLPWSLAFAAGAMLFVISDEIIPETHREHPATRATFGVVVGFVVMLVLDHVVG